MFEVEVWIYNQASRSSDNNPTEEVTVTFANVSFRNGSASKVWRDGMVEEGPPPPPPADTTWKWTAVSDSTFGESTINAVAWGNGRFVAGGRDGTMAYADW